jgi:hypothetical protein
MKKTRFANILAIATVILLGTVLLLGPAASSADKNEGEKPEKKDEQAEKGRSAKPVSPFVQAMGGRAKASEVKVYSNETLSEMFGGASEEVVESPTVTPAGAPTPPVQPAVPEKSPLERMAEQKKAREDHRILLTAAEKAVTDAEQRVAELEKRALAARNPLLPRPAPPEDEEERAAWNSADGVGRAAQADQQLQSAREALAKAREDLATLQRSAP